MPNILSLKRVPRLTYCALASLLALGILWIMAPQQVPLVLYKLAFIPLAGFACYWLDREVWPMAQPSGYLAKPWQDSPGFVPGAADFEVAPGCALLFLGACLRQALLVIAGMIAMGLAL
ncbi:MAG: hypothetical protein CVU73_11170 [Deltaproteobacteria bacterium HGW-Deltaproteobacteria-8]|jgi:hypothetical protein|nr:MAG: hypothetical protein CVU73_11170 [Deltaproteobacteria bacterium HGW-Deltaproteobacteria-8]